MQPGLQGGLINEVPTDPAHVGDVTEMPVGAGFPEVTELLEDHVLDPAHTAGRSAGMHSVEALGHSRARRCPPRMRLASLSCPGHRA